jgi:hypothetical protein
MIILRVEKQKREQMRGREILGERSRDKKRGR